MIFVATGVFMFAFGMRQCWLIDMSYRRPGEDMTDFRFHRYSLEDIIRAIFWARSAFLGLGLATIGALVRL